MSELGLDIFFSLARRWLLLRRAEKVSREAASCPGSAHLSLQAHIDKDPRDRKVSAAEQE